jgi:ribosomal protein S18 acetylase RimI-like enzyme
MITYRPMTTNDIPAGLSLCRAAGWNQTEADWELFLKISPGACIVGVDENEKVIGTVTTVRYHHYFSWIGMVLVDPGKKRQGIGTALLQHALEILRKESTVKLDATAAGREVYLKLQFEEEYGLTRMLANRVFVDPVSSNARPVEENDFDSVFHFDKNVFGADRKELLRHLWRRKPELAFVIETGGNISGYCFGRNGYHYTQIGPVVAERPEDAQQLVATALKNCSDRPVIVDIPHYPDWLAWLFSIGFTEQRAFTRMYLGANDAPGIPQRQFAILGPEFG